MELEGPRKWWGVIWNSNARSRWNLFGVFFACFFQRSLFKCNALTGPSPLTGLSRRGDSVSGTGRFTSLLLTAIHRSRECVETERDAHVRHASRFGCTHTRISPGGRKRGKKHSAACLSLEKNKKKKKTGEMCVNCAMTLTQRTHAVIVQIIR